jgi:glyceraldehyde 3-phosphate dehydrogenase
MAKVLHDVFGIERGLMTTVHSYTNDQRILDLMHKDLRRARAAAMNIVPTSTGAAKAIGFGDARVERQTARPIARVPTSTVSVVDLVVDLKKNASVESINGALKEMREGQMKGILAFCDEPLVSSDFRGNAASSIIDGLSTVTLEGKMAKVLSWYDNEWGYSCRVADLAKLMVAKGL